MVARHGRALGPTPSPAAAPPAPALRLETEATSRARLARARANQTQTLDGRRDEIWLSAGQPCGERGAATLRLQNDAQRRAIPRRALAHAHGADSLSSAGRNGAARANALPSKSDTAGLRLAATGDGEDGAQGSLRAARLADRKGEWRNAIRHYRDGLEDGSREPDAHFRLGVLIRKTGGDLRLGLDHLRHAAMLRPERLDYRRELAVVYEQLGFPINARRERALIRERLEAAAPRRVWRIRG